MEQDNQPLAVDAPPTTAPPIPQPQPLAPVAAHERIFALDVLRGFALLGIFMVNMPFFSMPFMSAVWDPSLAEAPASEQISWAIVKVFFEYKFVSMFSLLFGVGFTVQLMRAKARGGNFVPVYLRRMAVLFAMGLIHALLIWYGDILLIYSVIGLALFISIPLKSKALIGAAAAVLTFGAILAVGMAALTMLAPSFEPPASDTSQDEGVQEQTSSEVSPPAQPRRRLADLDARNGEFDPNSEAWKEVETNAFKHGPFIEAMLLRAVSYAYTIVFTMLGFGWHILAMFLLGAALMKLDFFSARFVGWHRALAFGLFPLGLAIEGASAYWSWGEAFEMGWHFVVVAGLHEFSSVFMSLGYVGIWCLIVHSGALRAVTKAFSNLGRMALTNYLLQSLTATFLMYWWGLGWFGDVSRAQQIGLVISIYLGQMLLSALWLRVFTIGPMEWLWRSLTYLRPQPLR